MMAQQQKQPTFSTIDQDQRNGGMGKIFQIGTTVLNFEQMNAQLSDDDADMVVVGDESTIDQYNYQKKTDLQV